MDKNEQRERIHETWDYCKFCSKPDRIIKEMILDKESWDKLPLMHKCGWARICQVAMKEKILKDDIWSSLCSKRGRLNNYQSPFDNSQSWIEDFVKHINGYMMMKTNNIRQCKIK